MVLRQFDFFSMPIQSSLVSFIGISISEGFSLLCLLPHFDQVLVLFIYLGASSRTNIAWTELHLLSFFLFRASLIQQVNMSGFGVVRIVEIILCVLILG